MHYKVLNSKLIYVMRIFVIQKVYNKRVLMGVPSYQLTTTFSANCQLTTTF